MIQRDLLRALRWNRELGGLAQRVGVDADVRHRSIAAIKTRIETRSRLKPALIAWFASRK